MATENETEVKTEADFEADMESQMKTFITASLSDGKPTKSANEGEDDFEDEDDEDEEYEGEEEKEELDEEADDDSDPEDEETDREGEENDEDEDEVVVEEKTPKKKKGVKGRIAELTKRAKDAEERAAKAEADAEVERRVAARLKSAGVEEKEPETKKVPEIKVDISDLSEPDASDQTKYPYGELDSAYIKDVVSYQTEVGIRKSDARRQQQEAGSREAERFKSKWDENIAPGIDAKTMPDFENIVVKAAEAGKYPLTPETGQLILDSKFGAPIAYKLATDLELAKKVAAKSVLDQAKWFGAEEAALQGKAKTGGKRKRTKAPKPIGEQSASSRQTQQPKGGTSSFSDFERLAMKG